MAFQEIDTSTDHGSYKGDPAKTAFEKVNENFAAAAVDLAFLRGSAGLNNLLINPSISTNQRVFAGGALAANTFGYDRWYAAAGGANVTFSGGVVNHSSGTICQVIESPQNTLGTTVTISVGDLSGGNLNVTAGGVAGTITPGAGRRSVNIIVPSSTSGGHVAITLSGTALTYRDVMVLRADQAGRFDARPPALELMLCQRYYETSYSTAVKPGTVSSLGRIGRAASTAQAGLNFQGHQFKVTKRSVPTMAIYSPGTGAAGVVMQDDLSSVSGGVQNVGTTGFEVAWSNTSGRWGGWIHYTAESELQ